MKMHIKVTCTINMQKLINKLNQIKDNIYNIISKHIIDYNLDCILVDEAQDTSCPSFRAATFSV